MERESILIVCKYSRIEYDGMRFRLTEEEVLNRYRSEKIYMASMVLSHKEQVECIRLVKRLFRGAHIIYSPQLNKSLSKGKELVISVGGDEHFKYVIHNSKEGLKYLNIRSDNLKSEGALSSCNKLNVEKMRDQILSDSYKLESWTILESYLEDKQLANGLGTIFVGSKKSTLMSRYLIKYRGMEEEQKSSGLLIVTGAGSTGWHRSAGGVSFGREIEEARFISREIYIGNTIKSKLRSGCLCKDEYLEITSLMDKDGIVEIDAMKEYKFRRGHTLRIKLSTKRLSVVSLS